MFPYPLGTEDSAIIVPLTSVPRQAPMMMPRDAPVDTKNPFQVLTSPFSMPSTDPCLD